MVPEAAPDGSRPARGLVLAVDDEADVLLVVERILGRAGFETRGHTSACEVVDELARADPEPDVIVTDLHMPGMSGLELLSAVRAARPTLPVVIMTGKATVESAVEAMRSGAYDYVVKPFDPPQTLATAVGRAVEHRRLVERNRDLERRLDVHDRFGGIVGSSRAMRDVFALVESVAPTDATVLVLGESGTGKELVARAVHERSARAARPFVTVNCGALSESVLESELFGHVRGAFTGAVAARRGLFEEASGGTLLLDEVGELSPATQVRLLRVLQEGEIRPVGSNEQRAVDVRVLAATHRDLAGDVRSGRFRQDLFYRLDVISIPVPPLRERPEDVPLLVHHFLAKHAAKMRKAVRSIDVEALERLSGHDWPGNVRELENAVERAIVLAKGDTITSDLLPATVGVPPAPTSAAPLGRAQPLSDARAAFERTYLRLVLDQAGGNVAEAARIAGVDRSNFRRLLKRHGVSARR